MSNKIKGYSTIGSVSKVTESGYANIGGVWKPITEAYTNIGGVWNAAWEAGEKPIGEFGVGSSVYMNVNGVSTEFIVIHQGLPSTAYDSSCNGTWLLMKDNYGTRKFGSSNSYGSSDIHSYLNSTFINLFDSSVKNVIKRVNIPYTNGSGTSGSVVTGSNGLSAKIFLLSYTETGFSGDTDANIEGVCLSAFKGNAKPAASGRFWLRTPSNANTTKAFIAFGDVSASGDVTVSVTAGVRPACVIDSSTIVYGKNIV